MMNLRDIGTKYDNHDDATVWINPANAPMMQEIVIGHLNRVQPHDSQAEALGDHRINNVRSAFIVLEGFVLDMDFKRDTTLKTYWHKREGLPITERWHLFLMVVNKADDQIIFDAYNATRLKAVEEAETDSQKKAPKSSESVETTPNGTKETQPA
jgi:hypothetical protein